MFSPEGTYPAAGIFSVGHLIALAVCIVVIILAEIFLSKISVRSLRHLTRAMAGIVTVLEIIKIVYKFRICGYKPGDLDQWIPLYFCSLFIYYAWFSAFDGPLAVLGDAFISIGAITGGAAFLIYPATSVASVPIWHFLSLHSMLFHTFMVTLGILYIRRGLFVPSRRTFHAYLASFLLFALPALLLNLLVGTNTMMLTHPYNMPAIVGAIYNFSHSLYTLLVACVYIFVPYGVSVGIYQLVALIRKKFPAADTPDGNRDSAHEAADTCTDGEEVPTPSH